MQRIRFTISLLLLVILSSLSQTMKRVPEDYFTVQEALSAAVNGDTVILAEGLYMVNLKITKKIVLGSLFLLDGDTSHISKTILDGSAPTHADSGAVVVLAAGTDSTTVVTGFTITKGTGMIIPWTYYVRFGGGIAMTEYGGGVIRHNIIAGNTVTIPANGLGGAAGISVNPGDLFVRPQKAIIENNIVENNRVIPSAITSRTEVGGIGVWQGYCRITGNIIRYNEVGWFNSSFSCAGGGILIDSEIGGSDSMIVWGNVIAGNRARIGGGIAAVGNGIRAMIHGNTIIGNIGDYMGGGVSIHYDVTGARVTNNYISGNSSPRGGGIRVNTTGPIYFANNIIAKNTASLYGGGFSLNNASGIQMVNNTIADNVCAAGHAINYYDTSPSFALPKLLNCILWGSGASILSVTATSGLMPDISYSLVAGGYTGTGIINSDPGFVVGDTLYRLQDTSPCVGTGIGSASLGGTTLTAPSYDYLRLNRPRPYDSRPDMGAIESNVGKGTRRVPQDYPTIQAAINAAVNGDTVLVSEGTYRVNLRITKTITLASMYLVDGDTSHISRTILDGGWNSVADSGSVICVGVGTDSTTWITGFTITNGTGTRLYDPSLGVDWRGGLGIYIYAGAARISHNIIINNSLTSSEPLFGGGIAIIPNPGPIGYWIIEHNKIISNHLTTSVTRANVGAEGGGLRLSLSGRVHHNLIYDNSVQTTGNNYAGGGGIYAGSFAGFELASLVSTNILITDNEVRGNSSSHWGGGIGAPVGPAGTSTLLVTLTNNIISKNTAPLLGSAIHFQGGSHVLVNNTIADNTGGAVIEVQSYRAAFTVRMLNNILWNPLVTSEYSVGGGSFPRKRYSDYNLVRTVMSGTGNISSNPGFMEGDTLFRLKDWSPCIGAGATSVDFGGAMLYAPTNDFLGAVRSRPAGSLPDIGAVEHDSAGPVDAVQDLTLGILPTRFALDQNFPNPFNPSTTIRFSLPRESIVRLTIYNLLGQQIAELVNEQLTPGVKQVVWEAKAPTGVYLCRLDVVGTDGERYSETRRMTVLK